MTYYLVPLGSGGGGAALTILEGAVFGILLGWRLHDRGVHIVICYLAGVAAMYVYCRLFSFTADKFKVGFFALSAICVALWGYVGYRIGFFFWPHDAVWQAAIALAAAAISFFDKKSLFESGI